MGKMVNGKRLWVWVWICLLVLMGWTWPGKAPAKTCRLDGKYRITLKTPKSLAKPGVPGKVSGIMNIELSGSDLRGVISDEQGRVLYKVQATPYGAGTSLSTHETWTVYKGTAEPVSPLNPSALRPRAGMAKPKLPRKLFFSVSLYSNPCGKVKGAVGDIRFEGQKM